MPFDFHPAVSFNYDLVCHLVSLISLAIRSLHDIVAQRVFIIIESGNSCYLPDL